MKGAARWRWEANPSADLNLVQIVLEEEPWAATYGLGGKSWERVAEIFAKLYPSASRVPDGRSCQDHYKLLVSRRQQLDQNPEGRSGSSEEFGEIDELLMACVERTDEFRKKTEEEKNARETEKKQHEDTHKRLKMHTRQTWSERRRTSSSSPTTSSSSSDVKSDGERAGDDCMEQVKRSRPGFKIQQHMLEHAKALEVQMIKLVQHSELQSIESKRSNDLFERFLQR